MAPRSNAALAQKILDAVARIHRALPRRAGLRAGLPWIQDLDQFRRNFVQEPRALRVAVRFPPKRAPLAGPREDQTVLGARHPNVTQPALLLDLLRVVAGELVRKEPLFETHEIHRREFEALRGVQRHQGDARSLVEVIRVRHQRGAVQEFGQRLSGALRCRGRVHQLAKVFDPALGFRRVLCFERLDVSGPLEDDPEERRHRAGIAFAYELSDQLVKTPERAPGASRQLGLGEFLLDRFPKRQLALARRPLERRDRRVSDAARRRVENAGERGGVPQVAGQPRVGQNVPYLGARIKTEPARHTVVDAASPQRLFQDARLGVSAIQHRDCRRIGRGERAPNSTRNERAFLLGSRRLIEAHARPARALGPERLALARRVATDDGAGRVENRLGRAVVLLEADDARAGIVLLESQDVLDGRATPAVDRLVLVADHAEVLVRARQQAYQLVLDAIGVLILIDQDVAKALVVLPANIVRRIEESRRLEKQIVEVERVRLPQFALVEIEDAGKLGSLGVARVPVHVLGNDAAVLRIADAAERAAWRFDLLFEAELFDGGPDRAELLVLRIDGELPGIPEPVDGTAQHADAEGMKGRDERRARTTHTAACEQGRDALLHLVGSLVGKGHRQDALGWDLLRLDQVSDAIGDDARLAAARSRENQ